MIKLKKVFKSISDVEIFSDFSASFYSQETAVIIGPSGCGKSTLLRLITGILGPDKGDIFFNNVQLNINSIAEIRSNIGYVIQEGGLFPNLTVGENLKLAPSYFKIEQSIISERIKELIDLTRLDQKLLTRYANELSGGQRQRVSLIRSLMMDPDYLILDEPLGALDPLIKNDLQKDLNKVFKKLNKTVILVTHDLSEAVYFADKILLLNNGVVQQHDTVQNFIESPQNNFVKKFINSQRNNHLLQ